MAKGTSEYPEMEKIINAVFVCSEDIEMLEILAGKIREDLKALYLPLDFYEMLVHFGQTVDQTSKGLLIWQRVLYFRIAQEKIRQQVNELNIPEQLQLPAPKRRRPPKPKGELK